MSCDYNETETREKIVLPNLNSAGWDTTTNAVRMEYKITAGKIIGKNQRGKILSADYVLQHNHTPIAVIEVKKTSLHVSEGITQAKKYAKLLQLPFAFATNGKTVYKINMRDGTQGEIAWDTFPNPKQLYADFCTPQDKNIDFALYEKLLQIPFQSAGEKWQPRYYQQNAINNTLKSIAQGKSRILLTLATGTGKTAIAAQICYKLYTAKWTNGNHNRDPRILFLTDRNILANQATNAFSIFPEDARIRITPEIVRKNKGELPKNGAVFFTIFQTLMTGDDTETDTDTAYTDDPTTYRYTQYAPDFFDLIIIDECHRGGANDESTWRQILQHFAPAVQIGLTATPKRDKNTDTYDYFGDPVYRYSLSQGIEDGFLTPFRIEHRNSNYDQYTHAVENLVKQGEITAGETVDNHRLATDVYIEQRETERVKQFMDHINPNEKTLVFCGTQQRAGIIRDIINCLHPTPNSTYCERVTANDGKDGETLLAQFQDTEKTIPTILTTSRKLSTGVDAQNIRNIVIFRPINSMIEFKQIIGRGTRLYEDKPYFTIYDFENATQIFKDPDWDGPPLPSPTRGKQTGGKQTESETTPPLIDITSPPKPETVIIHLSDGNAREIHFMQATSYNINGHIKPLHTIIQDLYKTIIHITPSEEDLRTWWQDPTKRQRFLRQLQDKHFETALLQQITKSLTDKNTDIFDMLVHIAFQTDIRTKSDRATHSKQQIQQTGEIRQFLEFVLNQYETNTQNIFNPDLQALLELKYNTVQDGLNTLGNIPENIHHLITKIHHHIYDI